MGRVSLETRSGDRISCFAWSRGCCRSKMRVRLLLLSAPLWSRFVYYVLLGLVLPPAAFGAGTRLKEVVSLEGVRDNQLVGYGLVVGLNGTGDKRQTVFSAQALTNILQRMGVSVAPT